MPRNLIQLLAALAAAAFALAVAAHSRPADCNKSRDPARCEAYQKAREACREKHGLARRQCTEELLLPPDCSKAQNPETCAATVAANAACRGRFGPAQRQCLREQSKPLKNLRQ